MWRELWPRERGLANGIIGFVAIIVVVALLYTLLDPAMSGVIDMASGQSSDPAVRDEISQPERIWGAIPVAGLFFAALFILARATFESRGPS